MLFKLPIIYSICHFMTGFLSYDIGILFVLFNIYQLYQYCSDIRIFAFSTEIKTGNSFLHTLRKYCEFFIGMICAYFFYRFS